jgi:hypothetical protein
MFWLNKNKSKKTAKTSTATNGAKSTCVGSDKGKSKGQVSSPDIRAQALANAKAARESLGEETIQKIVEAMARKKNDPVEQAKAQIAQQDAERVAHEILDMMGQTRH